MVISISAPVFKGIPQMQGGGQQQGFGGGGGGGGG
jgi:hypothetical protein